MIECSAATGTRSAGISIKSDRQVTGAGFPPDFVATAWMQWFGVKTERILRGSDDAVVLMVGSLSHDVEDAWSNLISDALITTPDRMRRGLPNPKPPRVHNLPPSNGHYSRAWVAPTSFVTKATAATAPRCSSFAAYG